MIELDIKATSDKGSIRKNNEDMILIQDTFVRDDTMHCHVSLSDSDRYIVAVADGMGGHNGGEVASETVLKSLSYAYRKVSAGLNVSSFNEAVYIWMDKINLRLQLKGVDKPELDGMGTTLVGVVVYGKNVYWMNCGDSRLYRFRNGMLTQISNDHSLSNIMGVKGHSNVIVNCIGGGCKTSYIDLVEFSADFVDGDIYVLCSDGLNDMLTDVDIERVIAAGGGSEELCAAAITAGGYDNVSVCFVKVAKS